MNFYLNKGVTEPEHSLVNPKISSIMKDEIGDERSNATKRIGTAFHGFFPNPWLNHTGSTFSLPFLTFSGIPPPTSLALFHSESSLPFSLGLGFLLQLLHWRERLFIYTPPTNAVKLRKECIKVEKEIVEFLSWLRDGEPDQCP